MCIRDRNIPVAKLMVFQFLQPLVGVVVAYFVIGERFTPWLFLGGAMIVSGVWTVNRRHSLSLIHISSPQNS